MKTGFLSYEILLPLRFNDGRPVPESLRAEVFVALRRRFHGASAETQTIRGEWEHEGKVYQDELVRFNVVVPDTPDSEEFFVEFKKYLKARFEQIDLLITSHPVKVI